MGEELHPLRFEGDLHPCSTCHYAMTAVNGVWSPPPGGVTVTPAGGRTYVTPHAEGCKGPAFTTVERFAFGLDRKDTT